MSFHSPGSWLWLIAAVLVVAFYLWSYTSQSRQVATYWLWQKALARRPAWIGLRRWASLATQVLVVLLVVAALAEPYWTSIFTARRNIAMMLDVSASMSASQAEPDRFQQMQDLARQAVTGMRRGERMAIITAASEIRTVQSLTDDQPSLLAAIDALQPSHGGTRVLHAVDAARAAVAGLPNASVIVISDGCFDGAQALAAVEDVRLVLVGEDVANAAVTRLLATRNPAIPSMQHVMVEVANHSGQEFAGHMQLTSDHGYDEGFEIKIPAGGTRRGMTGFTCKEDSLLTARLTPEDALPEDNVVWVPVRSQRPPMATLIGDVTTPLKSALTGLPQVDVSMVGSLVGLPPSMGVLVFHGEIPETLPAGPVLVVEPQNDCNLWKLGAELRGPGIAVGHVAAGSDLLAGVDAEGFVVERSQSLTFSVPVEPIIATESGNVLYADIARPEGRVLVLNVPLNRERSDLVLRPDFARLVDNAIRALSPPPTAPAEVWSVETSVPLEPSASPRQLKSPTGDIVEVAGDQAFAMLAEPGVWQWTADEPDTIQVNAAGVAEADLRRPAGLAADELEQLEPIHDQPLWMLLIGLALIVLTVEWCLFHRGYVV